MKLHNANVDPSAAEGLLARETGDAHKLRGPAQDAAHNRFMLNILSNVAYTGVSALANLWLTPFLIGCIGIAAYGMIPLTNSLVAYAAILTTSLDSSVSRFLSIELENKDFGAANKVFNSALFALLGSIVALMPVIVAVSIFFPILFQVPTGLERDASWLFILTAATFFATVLGGNFSVTPFLKSQFVRINAVNFLALAVKIGLIVLLYSLLPNYLWYAGAAALIGALANLAGFGYLWKRCSPEIRINIKDLDRQRLNTMAGMAGWVVVNMTGAMLLARADVIIINAFFGAAVTGGYASVVQLSLLLEYVVNAASIVLRPLILSKYAQMDFSGLQDLSVLSIKLLGLMLAIPVGLLCGFATPLLSLWLGPAYTFLSWLLFLVVFHQGLNLSVRPLLFVQNAYNRVKGPGIITLVTGVAAIVLAVLLSMWGKWGPAGVPIAIAITWTLKNVVYIPIYTARIMKMRWWVFLPPIAPGAVGTIFVGGCAYAISRFSYPGSWGALAGYSILIALAYAAIVWAAGLSEREKSFLKTQIRLSLTSRAA